MRVRPPKTVFKEAFNRAFTETTDDKDRVSASDIQQWAIDQKVPITLPIRIRETLAEIGIKRGDKKIKIKGDSLRGYRC
jgi:hypothetical protein